MTGPTWTNPDQVVFLTSRSVAFVEAQNAKKLPSFWTSTFRDFFLYWPNPDSEKVPNGLDPDWDGSGKSSKNNKKKKKRNSEPTVANPSDSTTISPTGMTGGAIGDSEKPGDGTLKESSKVAPPIEGETSKWVGDRRESVKNWFNNHGLNKGKRRAGKNQTVTLAIQQSAPRLLSERNMYSKLYYEDRVKPAVENEIGDRKVDRKERFAIINKFLDEFYEKESETVKEEIRKAIEKDREAKDAEKELSASVVNADEAFGPSEYLLAQSSLPDMITDFMEAMRKRTGWSFTMIAGGPDGAQGGNIRTISVHTGKDVYGQTFSKAVPNYVGNVLVPYSQFLESVYSDSARKAFRLKADGIPQMVPNPPENALATCSDKPDLPSSVPSIPLDNPVTSATAFTSQTPSLASGSSMTSASVAAPEATGLAPAGPFNFTPSLASGSSMTSATAAAPEATGLAPAGPFNFPASFQLENANEAGTQNYVDPFQTNPSVDPFQTNPNVASFMGMLNSDSESMGFGAWNNLPSNEPMYNAGESWPVGDPFNAAWGRTANIGNMVGGGMNSMGAGMNPAGGGMNMAHAMASGMNMTGGQTDTTGGQTGIIGGDMIPAGGAKIANTMSIGMDAAGGQIGMIGGDINAVGGAMNTTMVGLKALGQECQNQITEKVGGVTLSGAPIPSSSLMLAMPAKLVDETDPDVGEATLGTEGSSDDEETPDGTDKIPRVRTRKPTRKEIVPLTEMAPPTLPEWLVLSKTYLSEGPDVQEWKECIESWLKMENDIGLSEIGSQRLNVKSRPAVLTKWLGNRKFDSIPNVADIEGFAGEWLTWWNSIQPTWRRSAEEGSLPLPLLTTSNKEDLGCLRKGGPSGLVTMIIGLKWWAAIRDKDAKWLAAVQDMKACMGELVAPVKKRKVEQVEDGSKKKRRKKKAT